MNVELKKNIVFCNSYLQQFYKDVQTFIIFATREFLFNFENMNSFIGIIIKV